MASDVFPPIITGVCSLAAAIASVWFKDYLERRREQAAARKAGFQGQAAAPQPTERQSSSTVSVAQVAHEVTWMRPLLIVTSSWVVGNISRAAREALTLDGTHWEAIGSLVLLAAASLVLAWYHSRHDPNRGQGFYQLEVFALWAGYASGWSMVERSVWDDLVGMVLIWWLGCAIVGGVLVGVLARRAARRQ